MTASARKACSPTPPAIGRRQTAFGGSYSADVVADTLTYTWTPGSDCLFELIGPGTGTWTSTVTPVAVR